jgi:hypothetical protein
LGNQQNLLKMHQLEKDSKVKIYNNRHSSIKDSLVFNEKDTSYWTQYKRTHDYLGNLRGPGVERSYSDRRSFDVITGKRICKNYGQM